MAGRAAAVRLAAARASGARTAAVPRVCAHQPQRCYSEEKPKGFFSGFVDKLRQGAEESSQMKDGMEKLSKRAKELGESTSKASEAFAKSDVLRKAKESGKVLDEGKEAASGFLSKLVGSFKSRTAPEKDAAAKATGTALPDAPPAPGPEAASTAKTAAPKAKAAATDPSGEEAGPYTQAKKLMGLLKTELLDTSSELKKSNPYARPKSTRRQAIERASEIKKQQVKANPDAQDVVVHESSQWEQSWRNFQDNNPVMNRWLDFRMKLDESDAIPIRAMRSLTDAVGDKLSGAFDENDMSVALEEIHSADPSFDLQKFLTHCEVNVIPAVLEAFIAGDRATLKDWCSEVCFAHMNSLLEQREHAGIVDSSKILDLSDLELYTAQVMEQGPVLIMTFQAQQVICIRDRTGAITEGGEDEVKRVFYIFAMRRDPSVFDPMLAWQVMEMGQHTVMDTW